MLALAVVQITLPVMVIAWLLFGRPAILADLYLRIAAGWILLLGLAVAGIWLVVPLLTIAGLALLMLLAGVVAVIRFGPGRRKITKARRWTGHLIALGCAGIGLWAAVPAVAGWRNPVSAFDLEFPFREGRYIVANGGSTRRVNTHLMTLDERYRRWRGESFAVDVIRVDSAGFRTRDRRLFARPADPAEYLTFGTPVHAPCGGLVEDADSGRPDMPVPQRDREQLEGNFVRLRCGGNIVFLGHFRRNGVVVKAGDRVEAGQMLGAVGNSGNTDEPHLHIHAQTPGTEAAPLSGEPIPVTFNGRFLVRNMIIRADAEHD